MAEGIQRKVRSLIDGFNKFQIEKEQLIEKDKNQEKQKQRTQQLKYKSCNLNNFNYNLFDLSNDSQNFPLLLHVIFQSSFYSESNIVAISEKQKLVNKNKKIQVYQIMSLTNY
ncbi:unnamed protein product [Paramecium pentaurelia]|uniref:Uncharacterized protein n=1 Tax=Paramecium pentaurelia TaxID=43138 RepID=A0A8S1RXA7_9CILI|nr:unnamed protein product [Paramecium pentaurelia]